MKASIDSVKLSPAPKGVNFNVSGFIPWNILLPFLGIAGVIIVLALRSNDGK